MRDLVESYEGHWNKLLSESLKAANLASRGAPWEVLWEALWEPGWSKFVNHCFKDK